jgi:3-dehydroquinate synthase
VSIPRSIPVTTPGGSYEITVGPGLIHTVGGTLSRVAPDRRAFLITDENVCPLYAGAVETSIREAGLLVFKMTIRAGEASKSWATVAEIQEKMACSGFGRDTVVVALGGGVVGDIAGFVASTFVRGVPLVHVPTTLLAQVDSSIGGKNGVDLAHGKNLAGTFWQPLAVLTDTTCLESLPEPEMRSGLAEVVKGAIIGDADDLLAIELASEAVLARDPAALERIVGIAAAFKARVVSDDEREAGVRECLNYGHTYAHAIEKELGYGAISHGEAVAEGIRFAIFLAQRIVPCSEEWMRRQEALLDAYGLVSTGRWICPKAVLQTMHADKKARGSMVRYVISPQPLQCTVLSVTDDALLEALKAWFGRHEEAS